MRKRLKYFFGTHHSTVLASKCSSLIDAVCQLCWIMHIFIQNTGQVPGKEFVRFVNILVYCSVHLLAIVCHVPNVIQRLLHVSSAWNFVCLQLILAYWSCKMIVISWRWKAVHVSGSLFYSSEIPGPSSPVISSTWLHLCLKLISSQLP